MASSLSATSLLTRLPSLSLYLFLSLLPVLSSLLPSLSLSLSLPSFRLFLAPPQMLLAGKVVAAQREVTLLVEGLVRLRRCAAQATRQCNSAEWLRAAAT
eukprot:117851-Rhodomonas_salina.1